MTTFYVDLVNGSDAAAGTSWATAKKTISSTNQPAAAGDLIKVAQSPLPRNTGLTGAWTLPNNTDPAFTNCGGSVVATIGSPIKITSTAVHGLSTGDNVAVNTSVTVGGVAVSGIYTVTVLDPNSYTLNGTNATTGATTSISAALAFSTRHMSTKVASPTWKVIDHGEQNWTTAGATVAVAGPGSTPRTIFGYNNLVLTGAAGGTANTLLGYKTLPTTLDLSGQQQLGFVFASNLAIAGTQFVIKLCSDSAGTVPVASFALPALASATAGRTTAQYPMLIDLGAAIGTGINSIAIYTGSTAFTSTSSKAYFSNFVAFPSSSSTPITHASLIGTNDAKDLWLPVAGFSDNSIYVHSNGVSLATVPFHYEGGSKALWAREGIQTALQTATSTSLSGGIFLNRYGTVTQPVVIEGGYDPTTDTRTGRTFIDGMSGYGNGLYNQSNGQEWRSFSCVRFYYAVNPNATAANQIAFSNIDAIRVNIANVFYSTGLTVNRDWSMGFHSIIGATNAPFTTPYSSTTIIDYVVGSISPPTLGFGNSQIVINNVIGMTNTILPTSFGNNLTITLKNMIQTQSATAAVFESGTANAATGLRFVNSDLPNANDYLAIGNTFAFSDNLVFFENCTFGGSASISNGFSTDGGACYQSMGAGSDGTAGLGTVYATSANRSIAYPLYIRIAQAYVTAGSPVTATIQAYLSFATFPLAFYVRGLTGTGGFNSSPAVATASTGTVGSWQTVTLTWTPTTSGVADLMIAGYNTGAATTGYAYYDTITITQ